MLSDFNSGCLLVSSPPFFNGQLWSGQDAICVIANAAEHKGCEGQHRSNQTNSFDFAHGPNFARVKVCPNVELLDLTFQHTSD